MLDGSDTPHLVLYEVTNNSPLDGTIAYLTRPEGRVAPGSSRRTDGRAVRP
ncbi:MAG: hypothetical protein V3S62_08510 [Acidimicrobiia bacterium]